MAQLDTMLRALTDRGARELVFKEGAQPAFRYADGDKTVSPAALSRAQIVTLLAELASGQEGGALKAGQPARFVYTLADGRAFAIDAGAGAAGFQARIIPQAPAKAATPAPPAPAPATGHSPMKPIDLGKVRAGAPAIEAYLAYMVENGASDLHLSACETPMLRLHGEMIRIPGAKECSTEEAARLLFQLMPQRYKEEFEAGSDTDFAHEIPGLARFRCNVFADRKGPGGVFRIIPSKIPTAEDLGLSKAMLDLCYLSKGLVLVTGPTGSGKSTTLAAMIDHINRNRTDHIITIEDPIEFVHPNLKCLINQREIGVHTQGFKRALRAALREDPDIVLVGEMRDLETIAIAIETAETGHLVFGTLHTSTAPSTVDRVIDQFPADRQAQIRVMLSESLKGVISQTLLKKKGGGRVAAHEVLIGVPAISNLIREGKTFQIPSIMQTSRKIGMMMLNDSLVDLVRRDVVTPDEAYLKAVDKQGLIGQLKNANLGLPSTGSSATS
ncbi:MAG TPA: type IV pilus twitching motility protein PilT [Candidatus Polarisedimenticolaceae bacterium]|nr:type IV pilus twitching motility protein PilT [Candidatus Polarisedimenticolaceae bacterium]